MPLPHVIWRCLEGKRLPCMICIHARCRRCGSSVEVRFPLAPMAPKPEHLWCSLCGRVELSILSAVAMAGHAGRMEEGTR
jgi:hypothetical protein